MKTDMFIPVLVNYDLQIIVTLPLLASIRRPHPFGTLSPQTGEGQASGVVSLYSPILSSNYNPSPVVACNKTLTMRSLANPRAMMPTDSVPTQTRSANGISTRSVFADT